MINIFLPAPDDMKSLIDLLKSGDTIGAFVCLILLQIAAQEKIEGTLPL